MVIAWDDRIVPRLIGGPELRGLTKSGGRSNTGDEQRSFFGPGRWEIRYEVPIHTREKVLAWRPMVDRLRAGESILLKIFDVHRARIADPGNASFTVAAVVGAGATSLQVEGQGIAIEPGVHFSIGSRLYRINRISVADTTDDFEGSLAQILLSDDLRWSDTALWPDDAGAPRQQLHFLPPLRSAAAAGAALDFANLVCLCVPADPNDGDLSLDLGRFATPSITFRED